ncbi:MAG: AAA family ATPase [Acidimicrobiales bacterium]
MTFVGRTHELDVLDQALRDARSGACTTVWVDGAAGMGKTTLVRHFLDRACPSVVLWAATTPDATSQLEVLGQLLASAPETMRAMLGRTREAMCRGAQPARLGQLLAEALGLLHVGDGAAVMVLDGAQWVDQTSADTLRRTLLGLRVTPLLFIATARPGERSESQGTLRQLITAGAHPMHLALTGLSAIEVAEFAAARGTPLSLAAARRLAEHTHGNPAHVSALVDELEPAILARGWGPLPPPRHVSVDVCSRITACSRGAQALLGAVAVLASPAQIEAAARLSGVADPLASVEEAVAAGLLTEMVGATGNAVAFVEHMVELGVYCSLGARARRALHRQAIGLSHGEALLRHRIAAALGDSDGEEALGAELERTAENELTAGAPDLASAHLTQAAELAHDQQTRQGRLRAAAQAYLSLGDAAQAEALLAEAGFGEGAPASLLKGQLCLLKGQAGEAEARLGVICSGVEKPGDASTAAKAASHLATLALHRAKPHQVVGWAGRAEPQLCGATAGPSFAAALADAMAGKTAEALAGLTSRACTEPPDLGLHLALGALRMWTDDLSGAQRELSWVLASTEGRDEHLQLRTHALALASKAEYRAGCWDEAISHAESSARLSQEAGRPWHSALARSMAVLPLVGRGELTRAGEHVAAGAELAGPAPAAFVSACVLRARGALASALSDHEAALAAYTQADLACDPSEPAFFCDPDAKVATLLALGRLDDAAEALSVLEVRAVHSVRLLALAQVARLRATLAGAAGDRGAMLDHLRVGLAHVDGLRAPFEEARLRLDHGRALLNAGDTHEGLRELGSARSTLARLGARPLLAVCDGMFHQAATKPDANPLAPLTNREHQVAELVAAGLRNQDIAKRLYVNIKTIEAHLTMIYAKLGVRNRWQLKERIANDGPNPDLLT